MSADAQAAVPLSQIAKTVPLPDGQGVRVHASAVSLGAKGVLICGPAGSGKSGLALHLMAFGCALVSDDQTELRLASDGKLSASAPTGISGLIEARGVALLRAQPVACSDIALVVDMGQTENDRLPRRRTVSILGRPLRLFHKSAKVPFAAAILQYLKAGERPA